MRREITTPQKALRLLAVLVAGGEPRTAPGSYGEVGIFRGETRLNALMFWLRNPDYLAWELLDLHGATGDPSLVSLVERMLADEEPILRRDAMRKWRFGAHEPIDDEVAILSAHGLVRTVSKLVGLKSVENDFLLFPAAYELAGNLGGVEAYAWYANRMAVVLRVAGDRNGSDLKDRQYEQLEYAETPGGDPIPPITDRVAVRLRTVSKAA